MNYNHGKQLSCILKQLGKTMQNHLKAHAKSLKIQHFPLAVLPWQLAAVKDYISVIRMLKNNSSRNTTFRIHFLISCAQYRSLHISVCIAYWWLSMCLLFLLVSAVSNFLPLLPVSTQNGLQWEREKLSLGIHAWNLLTWHSPWSNLYKPKF